MTTTASWSVARLIRNHDAIHQLLPNVTTTNSLRYSPKELLSQFNQSSTLAVKRSSKQNRFFMYEEHAPVNVKLKDDQMNSQQTITASPNELATLLQSQSQSNNNNNTTSSSDHHYYYTSPIATSAPNLSPNFQFLQQLRATNEHPLLDPRGPSLWMGTSGSGTQCHYDVANNIIVQLYGSKRVRCYPPSAGLCLHVFPDAHPRARKSQVDFDKMNNNNGRFPHFVDLPQPSLDVILRPGDAIEIPAFWFHHVENGRIPFNSITKEEGDDAPSVSVNSFSLSQPMMVAQQIFQKASLPPPLQLVKRGRGRRNNSAITDDDSRILLASAILKVLGITLVRGLKVVECGKEEDFIRRYLLDARYDPLMLGDNDTDKDKMTSGGDSNNNNNNNDSTTTRPTLTNEQLQAATSCVEQILPDFQHLLMVEGEEEDDRNNGIALLVGLHLLELWAVELVGASSVARVWDEALS